jgi:hypothetical protein
MYKSLHTSVMTVLLHVNSFQSAWYLMVWYGMVWYGMVWYGMVWYGMVWYDLTGMV